MEHLKSIPTAIFPCIAPTFALYAAKLQPILHALLAPQEQQYGPDARHRVDVYREGEVSRQGKLPVLIFVHGGGFAVGDKRMQGVPGAHENVGSFFARRGFLTLIPNYRLTSEQANSERATFPSGGHDLSLLLLWLSTHHPDADLTRVFMLGNSAGAVHVSTLLCTDAIPPLGPEHPLPLSVEERGGVVIRAAVLLSMPAEFEAPTGQRKATLEAYFGGGEEVIRARCPVGLRGRSEDRTELLIATVELDPEEEVLVPNQHLISTLKSLPCPPPYETLHIKGHNHISAPFGLSLGGAEEQWGVDVVNWLLSRVAPSAALL